MASTLRVKLVGDDPEIIKLESVIRGERISCSRSLNTDDACDSQELEAADLFVLGAGEFSQGHVNQIQRLDPAPEIFLAASKKVPNLAKVMSPAILYVDWTPEEIVSQLEHGNALYRRKKRLAALRDHRNRSLNIESNPAINLVTNVMRRCTAAEQYPDILSALLTLRTVVDFHDSALVTLGENSEVLEAWHNSKELRETIHAVDLLGNGATASLFSGLEDGKVAFFSSSDPACATLENFTSNPWSFALAMRFSVFDPPRRSRSAKSAVLLLYRRELLPFVERDHWLMELTYGPLALALEKVAMLKAISQASKEWRSTFDGISEPLTVIDRNYTIVKANKAFARLVDQDIKKLKGRRCYTLLANRRQPCLGCPVGLSFQPQVGTRIQLQGKLKRDLLAWSYGIRTGLDSYHFQFYRNVSKETALASTLIQSEKMAALGRLVGAVAHEINNPLAGILATSQLMQEEAKQDGMDPSVLDDVEEIRSAAWRSKKIIDDLLGFTSEPKALEETNLLTAVNSALAFAKSAMREISVRVHSEKAAPKAFVSVNSLQQVLFNLITNAAQAMNGKGALEINIARDGEYYRIDVRDNGPGIPQEKLNHVFDPFFTSKQEGSGTGLGLSIVKSLIQKMGARIEVSSCSSKGTEFRIFLAREHGAGE